MTEQEKDIAFSVAFQSIVGAIVKLTGIDHAALEREAAKLAKNTPPVAVAAAGGFEPLSAEADARVRAQAGECVALFFDGRWQ